MVVPKAGGDAEKLDHSSVAEYKMKCEMVLPLWKMFWETEHEVTMQPSNCALGHLSLISRNLCSHENLDTDVSEQLYSW